VATPFYYCIVVQLPSNAQKINHNLLLLLFPPVLDLYIYIAL